MSFFPFRLVGNELHFFPGNGRRLPTPLDFETWRQQNYSGVTNRKMYSVFFGVPKEDRARIAHLVKHGVFSGDKIIDTADPLIALDRSLQTIDRHGRPVKRESYIQTRRALQHHARSMYPEREALAFFYYWDAETESLVCEHATDRHTTVSAADAVRRKKILQLEYGRKYPVVQCRGIFYVFRNSGLTLAQASKLLELGEETYADGVHKFRNVPNRAEDKAVPRYVRQI